MPFGMLNTIACDGRDLVMRANEQLWILPQMLELTLKATTVKQDVVGRMGKELV
jgi:hypothetical protein